MPHLSGNGSAFIIQHDSHIGAIELTKALLEGMPSDWSAVTLSECLNAAEDPYRSVWVQKREKSGAARMKLFW